MCPECQRPAPVGIQCVDCVREAAARIPATRSRLGFAQQVGPPVVTYTLIALNVVAFAYGNLVLGERRWLNDWAIYQGSEWFTWVLSGFAHVGVFHIAMNMLALYQLGRALEPALGRVRFAVIYGLSLLGGSLAVVLFHAVAVGASGAIFGLLAAYGIVLRRMRLPYNGVVVIAAIFIGGPLLVGFVPLLSQFFGNISWQGHLGGAIVGGITMLLMFRGVDRRDGRRTSKNTVM